MGAWGMKAYENDGAGDFCAELAESDDAMEMLSSAFADLDAEEIDVDEGQQAVMAAAIILHWSGGSDEHLGDVVKENIAAMQTSEAKSLIGDAIDGLGLVVSNGEQSELYELWEEADDFEEWLAEVSTLNQQLEALR